MIIIILIILIFIKKISVKITVIYRKFKRLKLSKRKTPTARV